VHNRKSYIVPFYDSARLVFRHIFRGAMVKHYNFGLGLWLVLWVRIRLMVMVRVVLELVLGLGIERQCLQYSDP